MLPSYLKQGHKWGLHWQVPTNGANGLRKLILIMFWLSWPTLCAHIMRDLPKIPTDFEVTLTEEINFRSLMVELTYSFCSWPDESAANDFPQNLRSCNTCDSPMDFLPCGLRLSSAPSEGCEGSAISSLVEPVWKKEFISHKLAS